MTQKEADERAAVELSEAAKEYGRKIVETDSPHGDKINIAYDWQMGFRHGYEAGIHHERERYRELVEAAKGIDPETTSCGRCLMVLEVLARLEENGEDGG